MGEHGDVWSKTDRRVMARWIAQQPDWKSLPRRDKFTAFLLKVSCRSPWPRDDEVPMGARNSTTTRGRLRAATGATTRTKTVRPFTGPQLQILLSYTYIPNELEIERMVRQYRIYLEKKKTDPTPKTEPVAAEHVISLLSEDEKDDAPDVPPVQKRKATDESDQRATSESTEKRRKMSSDG